MATGVGTATVDFTATPNQIGTVTVTGQAALTATDHVEAFFQGNDSTTDHTADNHKFIFPMFCQPVVDNVVAATGFRITLMFPFKVAGQVKVRWVWAS